jgi:hypothetical protein
VGVVNEVQHNVAEEALFNELARGVAAHRVATSTTTTGVEEEDGDVVLVGKTTISRSGTEILQSIFVRTGR